MNNEIKKRNTKQKSIILSYFEKNKDKHLTAEQILNDLSKTQEKSISQATIYRLLSALTSEGLIRKFFVDDKQSCCYQYVDNHNKCHDHYHLICNSCGKVYHFEENLIPELKTKLLKNNNFEIDTDKILFYGKCKNCN